MLAPIVIFPVGVYRDVRTRLRNVEVNMVEPGAIRSPDGVDRNVAAVRPRNRPVGVPRVLPKWAWSVFEWQHGQGPRPTSAPKKLPAWYWTWAEWRLSPFRLAGF